MDPVLETLRKMLESAEGDVKVRDTLYKRSLVLLDEAETRAYEYRHKLDLARAKVSEIMGEMDRERNR